ncbi:MAG: HAD hydrolase-like protein [Muribaculaceae bacterium]|nr:HAD hydrolase-like protein [Muribaculaceae bacterium]
MEKNNTLITDAIAHYTARTGGRKPAFRAALIDMDGTLLDSMKGHTAAWHRMVSELGIPCTREEFYLYEGMTGAATINLLFQRAYGREASDSEVKELYALKTRYFNEFPKVPVIEGARLMVDTLRSRGITRVLVTGSGQASNLVRLDEDFPGGFPARLRVTARDVVRGKPYPEPYLKAMELARVRPFESLAVENAPLGVKSAVAAGAFTVAVTTGPIPEEEMRSAGADLVLPSMACFAALLPELLDLCFPVAPACSQPLTFTNDVGRALDVAVARMEPSSVFILADSVTASLALPRLQAESEVAAGAAVITVESGEVNKSLDSLAAIWKSLSDAGANRRSLLINLGGGVITDMGAFAAATFKRGIRFINIPTTLLAAVDASVGGKTGIDFNSLKNEVGLFAQADEVIISTCFFTTLPAGQLRVGYAEMLKHAMITSPEMTGRLMGADVEACTPDALLALVRESVEVKRRVVEQDFGEKGLRRVLNFGHTAAHAFESLAMERGDSLSHGYAVAFGMLVELVLSRMTLGFPSETLHAYAAYVAENYGAFRFTCHDYPALLRFMHHDKKNTGADISCVLLRALGEPVPGQSVSDADMTAALDIYRDLLHLP